LSKSSKIKNRKIAIKIEGFYSIIIFVESIYDSKIKNRKNAIKINGFYQNKIMLNICYI